MGIQIEVDAEALRRILKAEGIRNQERILAFSEVIRVAELGWYGLFSDTTISPLDCTGGQWHRQKPENAAFRTILECRIDADVLYIHAIVRRDETTYDRVCAMFQNLNR
ncbi:MAG: hypothetical protein SF029_11030 [bacterium]|nr:hypothetical protein [bacterium]